MKLGAKGKGLSVGPKNLVLMDSSSVVPLHACSLLSYDSVRSRQDVRGNRQADLLGSLQIDDELKLHRLLHRQIGGFDST
jgi:hypothetical protein